MQHYQWKNRQTLNIKGFYSGPRQLNYSDFIIFKDLKSLDLSYAQISNCTKTDEGLKNLEVLNLNYNPLYNAKSIMSCLDGLSVKEPSIANELVTLGTS
ncbi:receptor protein [Trifolium repens]|nr:receptor protein [Trifolium repens]